MTKLHKKALIFLVISFCIWCLIPLVRQSLPLDTQEVIIWGRYGLWGTPKHPPFSGWIAIAFYRLFGGWDGSMYILSQVCVVLGLFGIYRLGRLFLKPVPALLATAFQMGIIFYHFAAVEFNVNVLSLALWPWTAFFFWQAWRQDKWTDWILFGVMMGVNVLNKYVGSVLGLALGCFVLICPEARRILKNPKAYVSALVGSLCLLPHLHWLYQNNFEMWKYIAARNTTGKMASGLRHIVYPVKFLAAQILFALPAGLTYFLMARKAPKDAERTDRAERMFLLCLGIVPTAFWMISTLISGKALKDMWNFPSLFAWGLIAVYFVPRLWDMCRAGRFLTLMFGWSLLFAVGYGVQCLITPSERFQSDCPKIVRNLLADYRQKTGENMPAYVGGTIWFSDMVALYAPVEIKPMIWMKPAINPWFDRRDFEAHRTLVVAESEAEYQAYRDELGTDLSAPERVEVSYISPLGKVKKKPFFWGVYKKEKVHEE